MGQSNSRKDVSTFWVYILEVSNGNYYTGYTNNIKRRCREHFSEKGGCRYTRSFKPKRLRRYWKIKGSQGDAMRVESFIKRQTRKVKDDIVNNPKILKKLLRDKENLFDTKIITVFKKLKY